MLARILSYGWALPNTLLGFFFLPLVLVFGGTARRVGGVLEVQGRGIAWLLRRLVPLRGGASAITLGHVVLGRSVSELERSRAHEQVHVRQSERWGPLFIPAYLIAGLVALVKGGSPYYDNPFERQARAASRSDYRKSSSRVESHTIQATTGHKP